MELKPNAVIHGFLIDSCEALPEIEGKAITGLHEASGAKLLYLQNDDENKSFAIGFRTPPADDTGVFHILEHSVLCGSRKFPVKEPFVDLLKGSMQTFLNAMTFGDKTLYPVASTNKQDLYNLMDVYLDAVFHPRIYEKRQIFEQEGWHYELKRDEDSVAGDVALVYNGVVFNEMKGALSDANTVLYNTLQASLFSDNCYAYESGGIPATIPTLTYENFLDEHRCHYRTDNSYIILYGNLDIDRALAFLDERYLSPVADEQRAIDEVREAAGLAPLTPRTIEPQDWCRFTSRVPMRTAPENACAGCAWVIGTSRDRTRVFATDILLDALLGSNEAPLKRRLLDMGLAHDIHAYVSDALLQPFAVIQLQMPDNKTPFSNAIVIENEIKRLLEEGLDHKLIEAALSHEEFRMREHDFGMADGVVYAMNALSGWLYDDDAATDYLRYEDMFAELRRELPNGYFEDLARTLFCENDHAGEAEIVPNPDAYDGGLSERLEAAKSALTPSKVDQIDAEVALLRELQEQPHPPEAIATLPRLSISDIGDAPAEPAFSLDPDAPLPCLRHQVPTRGIAYAYRYFDLDRIPFDELPYVSLLGYVLGKLDTAEHTASQLDTIIQDKLGNLSFFTEAFEDKADARKARPMFVVSSSALSKNMDALVSLPLEVMTSTDFNATDKILDILKQRKISLEQAFANSGHSSAVSRLKSYYSAAGVVNEQLGNVDFYRFVCELIDNYDQRADELANRLADVARRLFSDDACTMSFAGSDADYELFWQTSATPGISDAPRGQLHIPAPIVRNEAFVVPSDVCFTSMGWDRRLLGLDYSGSWAVASRALSLDYLWNEVRVKGGAYGCGFQAQRGGNMRFHSYRDPHLDETIARFKDASSWLSGFNPSKEDFEGFVVASVASMDTPVKPRTLMRRQAGEFLAERPSGERRLLRSQIIATTPEDVRSLGSALDQMSEQKAFCVFGNRAILESAATPLTVISLVG